MRETPDTGEVSGVSSVTAVVVAGLCLHRRHRDSLVFLFFYGDMRVQESQARTWKYVCHCLGVIGLWRLGWIAGLSILAYISLLLWLWDRFVTTPPVLYLHRYRYQGGHRKSG